MEKGPLRRLHGRGVSLPTNVTKGPKTPRSMLQNLLVSPAYKFSRGEGTIHFNSISRRIHTKRTNFGNFIFFTILPTRHYILFNSIVLLHNITKYHLQPKPMLINKITIPPLLHLHLNCEH